MQVRGLFCIQCANTIRFVSRETENTEHKMAASGTNLLFSFSSCYLDTVNKPIKQPFSYYGGKQRLAPKIIPLIPRHTVYVEPFCGGATVFFRKPWPQVTNNNHYREVLNDTDKRIVNFFEQMRDNPDELTRRIALTPFSQHEHTVVARQPTDDPIEQARRWYVDVNQSFINRPHGGWQTGTYGRNLSATWQNKLGDLWSAAERLRGVSLDCNDALKVIDRWDSPQTFFYCDLPYPGTDQGHYSGYSQADFDALVQTLDKCQGSFMLSCYPQAEIPDDWERFEFSAHCAASRQGKAGVGRDKSRKATTAEIGDRKRTEVVWRRFNTAPVRPEIQKLYDEGKFDCFASS